jgi:hypothetical protein
MVPLNNVRHHHEKRSKCQKKKKRAAIPLVQSFPTKAKMSIELRETKEKKKRRGVKGEQRKKKRREGVKNAHMIIAANTQRLIMTLQRSNAE